MLEFDEIKSRCDGFIAGGAAGVFLMTMHRFGFDWFRDMCHSLKQSLPKDFMILANVGDISIEQIKELERKIEQKEIDAQKKEELKKKIDAFQKSVDELDRYEQMKELFKTAEQFGKEMEAMDDKKAFREHTQKIIQMVEEMDNTSAAINEIRQTGLHPSISSGLQAPGTFAPNKTLFQ